jgi:glucose/arabinose dehydrogenase
MQSKGLWVTALALACSGLLACNGQSSNNSPPPPPSVSPPTPPVAQPPAPQPPAPQPPAPQPPQPPATLEFTQEPLTVAAGLTAAPLDVPRTMTIPKDMKISVYARIPGARFMRLAPNGDLFVSQPGDINSSDANASGSILLVRRGANGNASVTTFASGLRKPHDMSFKDIGGKTYFYYSESNAVSRAIYKSGDTTLSTKEPIITGLLDRSSGELQGKYGHALKNFVISGDKIFLSVASATNADPADLAAAQKRGAIYQYNLDGTGSRLYAQGLRNAEGLDVEPVSGKLWVAVNNRDNIRYPPGHPQEGQLDKAYVDNHPPEEFTAVRDGGNYGWPFCNPNPDAGMANMPFDRDWENNKDGSALDCSKADRISVGIQAHSAPLGLSFIKTNRLEGAVSGLHGSWNRTEKTGYKVVYFPFTAGQAGAQVDLVTGFLIGQSAWGRPVDAVSDGAQGLFISDDGAGAIYHLEPK